MEKNLAIEMLSGNTMNNFLKTVGEFNINFHKAILVSKEPEIIEPYNA